MKNYWPARFLRFFPPVALLVVLLLLVAVPVRSAPAPSADTVDERLRSFRQQALREGLPESLVDTALRGLSVDSSVLKNHRNQPEFSMEYPRYRELFVTEEMVRRGRRALEEHEDLLRDLEADYGVPAEVLVAIWGVESRYGRHQNQYDVLRSVYTMAFGRSGRSEYFEGELLAVLRILHRDLIPRDRLRGSWAGAMGQPQFMPSSYLAYAVDYDEDGRTNLWTSEADVLASIAHYLAEHGWDPEEDWGRELGEEVADSSVERIVKPEGSERRFERTSNFDVILRYNQSEHYALVVGELSERLRQGKESSSGN